MTSASIKKEHLPVKEKRLLKIMAWPILIAGIIPGQAVELLSG